MLEKEEKLTLVDIKTQLDKKKEVKDKIKFLKPFLEDEKYKDTTKDLIKSIVPNLLDKDNQVIEYRLTYDSLSEGLEPIYFWILDFMRDSSPGGLGLEVKKGLETYEASVSSGYFGEMGQRATLMQQKAMEYMGTINNIIKSIINLIYDLKEFEIRIQAYNDSHSNDEAVKDAGIKSLKGIWMDQVDMRKGRGSINSLAQDLQFITLRDAFFYVNNEKEIKEKDVDLNTRVKNILIKKLEEYNSWVSYSEKEIRKRYNLEKIYLRSQVGTLKLYANWVKPYLVAAQKLKMRGTEIESFSNPNIVNAFSNMEMEIKLYGRKEIKPESVHESYKGIDLGKKYYVVIEVVASFRSLPTALSGQGGRQYVHGGRTDIIFRSFVFDTTELNALDSYELYEDLDLIESYIGMSLELLQQEIAEYLTDKPKEEKKEPQKSQNPFKGTIKGFKQMFSPISFALPKKKISPVIYEDIEKAAKDSAKKTLYLIYNIYKKTHGMAST